MSTATVRDTKQGAAAFSLELDDNLIEKDEHDGVPSSQQLSKADLFFILVVLSLIFVTQHFYNTTYL